jgi:hypothetical protein
MSSQARRAINCHAGVMGVDFHAMARCIVARLVSGDSLLTLAWRISENGEGRSMVDAAFAFHLA